jgi:hypothetical protein
MWFGVKKASGMWVYSKEYAFPILFIYDLFNSGVNSLGYAASDDRTVNEKWINSKGYGR